MAFVCNHPEREKESGGQQEGGQTHDEYRKEKGHTVRKHRVGKDG